MIADLLQAMRADAVPDNQIGLWKIYRKRSTVGCPHGSQLGKPLFLSPKFFCPAGTYTFLVKLDAPDQPNSPPAVMEDTPPELRKHLNFVLRARGKVLVTGLGLGCVVRGLLQRSAIERITIVEREQAVLSLVAPYLPKDERIEIVHAEAGAWLRRRRRTWTCAWHDVWSDPERNEPHLAVTHQNLMLQLLQGDRVGMQGAWEFPRYVRRILRWKFPQCQWL